MARREGRGGVGMAAGASSAPCFRAAESGNVGMIFGLVAPVLFGVVGFSVDYASWHRQKSALQIAADAAALAVAAEMQISAPDDRRIQEIARSVVDAHVKPGERDGPVTVKAASVRQPGPAGSNQGSASNPPSGVRVELTQRKSAVLSRLVTPVLTDLAVGASAQFAGGTRVCVVGLEGAAKDTMRLQDGARLTAGACAVYVNSKDPGALRAERNAVVTSQLTCVKGGAVGGAGNFAPGRPKTGCPVIPDPLANRAAPNVDVTCGKSPKQLVIKNETRTLSPGTYCGGIMVAKGGVVTLNPGVYIMKDGPLIVGPCRPGDNKCEDSEDEDDDGLQGSAGVLKGDGVGFYFTGEIKQGKKSGNNIAMRFEPNSVVELTAPLTDEMAGLLIHEDRAAPKDRRYEVLSTGARRLVGTIYVPNGVFEVSANQAVADQSEYTAIVVRRLEMSESPNLVINARYGDTRVPVPQGLGPTSGAIKLTQ